MIGSRVGSYEITAELGTGGMGEVYRARDTRLEREVAIKVLPQSVAGDPERLARFEREAKLLAQLHHPNVASIFGLEESGATRALVMELVEGPTLAERIAQGPLASEDALPIARQIAEGLEFAHEHGVIHRDLKPANIKLAGDGRVKILDFGLAKAMEPAGAGLGSGTAAELTHSPTMTLGATVQGVLLGTAGYMAPEQAKGFAVDKRADVWAFGVVLYEMLSGRPLFAGDSVTDTLAGVLKTEIDFAALPAGTSPAIRRLLRRCLERNPKNRLHDIADARIVLDDVLAGGAADALVIGSSSAAVTVPARRRLLPWVVAALGLVAGAAAWLVVGRRATTGPLFVDLAAPEGTRFLFQGDFGAPLVLSRDATEIAFGAVGSDSKTRLWVRSLGSGEVKQLAGTEGATAPFFSPDGASLGYFADARMMIVSVAGGAPYAVADAPHGRGAAWAPDGTIVFGPDFRTPLLRVPATGGKPVPFTTLDESRHSSHRWPTLTPDGEAIVYLAINHDPAKAGESELRWIRLDGSDDHALTPAEANGAVAGGELLYLHARSLLARSIDGRGALQGAPRTLAVDLLYDASTWRSAFAAGADRLIYAPGGRSEGTHLSRVDRGGKPLAEIAGDGQYLDLRLSPDGHRLAVSRGLPSDVWLFDLDRGTQSRFTFEPTNENSAVWSRDGRWIYYGRASDSGVVSSQIARKAANGSGGTEVLCDTSSSGFGLFPTDASPDGKWLLVTTGTFPFVDRADLQWLALDGSHRLVPLLASPAADSYGRISPDGRWVAYQSNESGMDQIYVVPASHAENPRVGAKWQISVDGGGFPVWSRDGREIVFLGQSLILSRVEVADDGAGGLRFGTPQTMFGTTLVADQASYDLAPDGESLILNHFGTAQARPLRMIESWRRLLDR